MEKTLFSSSQWIKREPSETSQGTASSGELNQFTESPIQYHRDDLRSGVTNDDHQPPLLRATSSSFLSQGNTIDVVIIPLTTMKAASFDDNRTASFKISTCGSVRNIVEEYQRRVPQIGPVRLATFSSHEILLPDREIGSLPHSEPLVLRAIEVDLPNFTNDKIQSMTHLWTVFAISQITELVHRYKIFSMDTIHSVVVGRWHAASDGVVAQYQRWQELLQTTMKDETDLRSFFIFYHHHFDHLSIQNDVSSAPKNDSLFKTALSQWQDQSDDRLMVARLEAVINEQKYPIPAVPTRAPHCHVDNAANLSEPPFPFETFFPEPPDSALDDDFDTDSLAVEIASARSFLKQVSEKLASYGKDAYRLQLQQIDQVLQPEQREGVKIGIFGSTGAGKSSLLNSLLDEAMILPTSSWRACTAVVTEIKYIDDPAHPYHAIVNFIDKSSWSDELKVLVRELADAKANLSSPQKVISEEAKVAWEKLHAVYPRLSQDQIPFTNVTALLEDPFVVGTLGQKKEFQAVDAKSLSANLRKFIASDNKRAYWPLVKSVQLFSPSELLKQGVTLVDLPGQHDENKARASVAQRYLQECSHIWIVAPLTRAIDDRTAKTLLGQTFKQQMALDGTYGAISFICSKSDEIGPFLESAISFDITDEINPLDAKLDLLEKEIVNLKGELSQARFSREEFDEHTAPVEANGRGVLRHGSDLRPGAQKRRRVSTQPTDNHVRIAADLSGANEIYLQDHPSNSELPKDRPQISMHTVEEPVGRAKDLARKIKAKVKNLELEKGEVNAEKWRLCVAARNEAAKTIIRSDFQAGLREYKQDLAQEADDFDPDAELDGLERTEDELPVFCVSARGFQRMRGHFAKIDSRDEFSHPDQTGIPALVQHAITLGRASNVDHLKRQSHSVQLALSKLKLWCHSNESEAFLTDEDARWGDFQIRNAVDQLRKDLTKQVNEMMSTIRSTIEEDVYSQSARALESARKHAQNTSLSWNRPPRHGGIRWQTYKAIVIRDGAFSGSNGTHDFNEQLIRPMMQAMIPGWTKAFHANIPKVIEHGYLRAQEILDLFEMSARQQADQKGPMSVVHRLFSEQVPRYRDRLQQSFDLLRTNLLAQQRNANRQFLPVVRQYMLQGYDAASAESGRGSLLRMQTAVTGQVQSMKSTMFQAAQTTVQLQIKQAIATDATNTTESVQQMVRDLEDDYFAIFHSRQNDVKFQDAVLKREIRAMLEQFNQSTHMEQTL